MMVMMMLILVSGLAAQITFGAEPLASISRPFHPNNLPSLNTTTQPFEMLVFWKNFMSIVKITSWLHFSHAILSFDTWRLLWWFTSDNLDLVTYLDMISMFTDAYPRLTAYVLKTSLLMCYCYLWCNCYVMMILDDDVPWIYSLRLLQAQHSLSVVLLFICILVSVKVEVVATTTSILLVQRQYGLFVVIFFFWFSWWYLSVSSSSCLLFLSRAPCICFNDTSADEGVYFCVVSSRSLKSWLKAIPIPTVPHA